MNRAILGLVIATLCGSTSPLGNAAGYSATTSSLKWTGLNSQSNTRHSSETAGRLIAQGAGVSFVPIRFSSGNISLQAKPGGNLDFNPRVARPGYVKTHPRVLFDDAHNNADTSVGRYGPFVDLIKNDGYRVTPTTGIFSSIQLRNYDVVVIVNPAGPGSQREALAFTEAECDAIHNFVSAGGALLLIIDHAPYSSAVAGLSKRFGVQITNGYTFDTVQYDKGSGDETELLFTRDNGLLGTHPITNGRDSMEGINRIITYSGTSLKGPNGSVPLLRLADTAKDVLPPERKQLKPDDPPPDHRPVSAAGRAQGIAFSLGKGRVVVLGEAAMITAQVDPRGLRFGMNVAGIDNRQLALNIMHWLTGLLK
ncbi:MAG: hypothetical protein WAV20_24440 [Blastocatellia bacterium]